MDIDAMRGAMRDKKKTPADLAAALSIDESTFYRKLNSNGDKFTVAQARKIAQVLEMTEADAAAIFFR